MKQFGTVTDVHGKFAKIIMQKHSSCDKCSACKFGDKDTQLEIEAINEACAEVGQRVEVDMESQHVLTAAFIVYIIPLIALILGIYIGSTILPALGVIQRGDLAGAAIGFLFVVLAFIGIRSKDKFFKSSKKYMPIIKEIVDTEE